MCASPGDAQCKTWPCCREFSKCEARSSAQAGGMRVKGTVSGTRGWLSGCWDRRLRGLSGRGMDGPPVTAPPGTRCCSGPAIEGRRWEIGCCGGRRGIQLQHHRGIPCIRGVPGSASELVSPVGFDVPASPTWVSCTQQHRSSAKTLCCIHGRSTLELRCLTYPSNAIWRCCWGFLPAALSLLGSSSVPAEGQHRRQRVRQRALPVRPPAAAPGMGWCARLHPAVGGTALALPTPAHSGFVLNLRKHDWKKNVPWGPVCF